VGGGGGVRGAVLADILFYTVHGKMDSSYRSLSRRAGHIAARQVGMQNMLGQNSRTWAPQHNSVIQDYSGPGTNGGGGGGGGLVHSAKDVFHGAKGATGDLVSGARHIGQFATDPIAGAKGLVGDVMSGVKHGMQAAKGALPFAPIVAAML
jgi:hypothetical protein